METKDYISCEKTFTDCYVLDSLSHTLLQKVPINTQTTRKFP